MCTGILGFPAYLPSILLEAPAPPKPLCSFFLFCLALAFALRALPLTETAPNLSVTLPLFLPSLCAPQGEVKEIKE